MEHSSSSPSAGEAPPPELSLSPSSNHHHQGNLVLAPHPDFVFAFPFLDKSCWEPLLGVYPGRVAGVDEPVFFFYEDCQWVVRHGRLFTEEEWAQVEQSPLLQQEWGPFWRTQESDVDSPEKRAAYYDWYYQHHFQVPPYIIQSQLEDHSKFMDALGESWRRTLTTIPPDLHAALIETDSMVEAERRHFWAFANSMETLEPAEMQQDLTDLIAKNRPVQKKRQRVLDAAAHDTTYGLWTDHIVFGQPNWFQGHDHTPTSANGDPYLFVGQFWSDDLGHWGSKLLYLFYHLGEKQMVLVHDYD